MIEYGMTSNGFVIKPFSVILEELQGDFRMAFGQDIDLSTDSISGSYVNNMALKLSQLWEICGALYSVNDIDSASGIYLDRLAKFVNVNRIASQPTQVVVALFGNEGVIIPAGNLVRIPLGETFSLQTTTTINQNSLIVLKVVVSVVQEQEYSIQLNTTFYSYTAQPSDTELEILQGLRDNILFVSPDRYSAFVEEGVLSILSVDGITPYTLSSLSNELNIDTIASPANYSALNNGAILVNIGDISEIVSPVTGLEQVQNFASGVTGRASESDTELRVAIGIRQKQANANEIAIQNAVLDVPSVLFCRVYSNRSMEFVGTRPPKSYEVVVVGGNDQAIAETIFNIGPAGIEAFGTTNIEVRDIEGFPWNIGFSRPRNKYIWVKVEFKRNLEEILPSNATVAIEQAIIEWAAANLNVGVDLIFQMLFKPIYSIAGVGYATIEVALTDLPTDTPVYASNNLVIGEVEIGVIDASRITVSEIP